MKLIDTVPLMNSEDYKNRFKAEYYQVYIRFVKLKSNSSLSHFSNIAFNLTKRI